MRLYNQFQPNVQPSLPPPQQPLQVVSLQSLQAGFRSKREMYAFLVNEGGAYLPKMESIAIEFMKAIFVGQKEVSGFSTSCCRWWWIAALLI